MHIHPVGYELKRSLCNSSATSVVSAQSDDVDSAAQPARIRQGDERLGKLSMYLANKQQAII